LLSRWGEVHQADTLTGLPIAPDEAAPRLVVLDARPFAAVTPALIQDWLRQCGKTRLLLAGTRMAPLDELAALAAGAVACCDASLPPEEFERIVRVVLDGGVWISKAAIPLLMAKLQGFAAPPAAPAATPDRLDGLTERQREVAKMVGRGASNKQIARELDISDRTVKAHLTSIFEKLGISDRLQLALHVNASRPDARG
jgi:DNA-binding NarL/FixJ family response regulator